MPKFKMNIMIAEKDKENFESFEYEVMCWVKDLNDFEEVQTTANDIINQQIENTKREILFGSASVIIESEEVMSIGFKNSNADPEDVNKILDLFELNEETIH
jgi:hypothetical protein|tara:strand:- start:943 stop:1248 length:306 start_codon:yes stop_codon:yes gene_type:complete